MKGLRIRCLFLWACCLAFSLGGCSWLIPDLEPTAMISATPTSGRAPLAVRLSGSLSDDDAAILDYTWEFPDQDVAAVHGVQTERNYQQSGEYTVRLTVLDSAGQSDTAELVIKVENTAPIASCRFSNDAPVRRESVLFDASASYDSDGRLVDFIWDFGDGSTRRGTRVSHVYEEIGLYVVRLTVVDNAGAVGTISHTMTVHEATTGGGCGG
ncbi:PKD domain-containing protein [Candidatus Bipolaricaulota bacterium]